LGASTKGETALKVEGACRPLSKKKGVLQAAQGGSFRRGETPVSGKHKKKKGPCGLGGRKRDGGHLRPAKGKGGTGIMGPNFIRREKETGFR